MTFTLLQWGEFLDPLFADTIRRGGGAIRRVDSAEEVREAGADVDAAFVRMPHYLSADLMAALPGLRVVAVPGAGLEVVDLDGATRAGIPVVSGRGIGTHAVVEWTIASILWLARDMGAMHAAMAAGDWSARTRLEGRRDVRALTCGIVGFGFIGRGVAEVLRSAFGSRVLVTDLVPEVCERAAAAGFEVVTLARLLEESDVVSVHTQVRQGEPPSIGAAELARARPGAFLVNTTRGAALDYEALTAALADGRLGGAALDVYPTEPPPPALVEALVAHPRVLLSPHQAGMSHDAIEALAREVAASVVAVLGGEQVANCANPEVWEAATA